MFELIIDDLACGYGVKTVLANVSFALGGGDFLCLLGPNGAGKTTLFKTLLRLMKPKSGRILLDGEDVASWSHRRFAARIGYVPQAHMPPFPYKVLDVVAMGRTSRLGLLGSPSRSDVAIAEEALQLMSIGHLKDADCTRISGGERQLALIARALAQQPDILVMDEPASNLDFGNQIAVLDLVAQLAEERAIGVIMTTHDPNHALLYASMVAAIGRGGTLKVGAPEQVVNEDYLRDTYGVVPHAALTRLDDGRMAKVFLPMGKGRRARASLLQWKGVAIALLLGMALIVGAGSRRALAGEASPGRSVIDMTGRSVDLPGKVERVACLEVLCYQKLLMLGAADRVVTMTMTSAPWMAAVNPRVASIEKIPVEPNFEDLLLKRTDVAFFAYNADRTIKKLASLGIPGIISQPVGRAAATAEEFVADTKRAMRLFGQVLGGEAQERAEDWLRYFDDKAGFVAARLSGLAAGPRPKLYYLRGPGALHTQGKGSNTFWYGQMAGADMVVKDLPLAGKGQVSMEDIVRWNPDVILVGRQYPLDLALKDDRWADIAAVRSGRVISSPEGVFYWDGGPEGVLLMLFLAKQLHPELFTDLDMAAEVKDYYTRFYGFQLSDDQAALILRGQSPDGSRSNAMNN